MVSVDPPTADGSRRMLLQSIQRPDLGLTVLRLQPGGQKLDGGDETWTAGEPPIIQAARSRPPTQLACPVAERSPARRAASPAVTKATSASPAAVAAETSPQQGISPPRMPAAPAGVKRPAGRDLRGAFASAETAAPEEEVDPRMPLPLHGSDGNSTFEGPNEQRAARAAVAGGVGRSAGGSSGSKVALPSGVAQESASPSGSDARWLRPDLLMGSPDQLHQDAPLSPDALDEEIRAASAAAAERLVSAAFAGDIGNLRLLLARTGVDVTAPSGRFQGLTPLMAAAERGRSEAVALLLERRASLELKDALGWTALMHAVDSQRVEVTQQLLEAGAAVNRPARETTPLLLAAAGARPELCSLLLKARANFEAADADGCRALHLASQRGRGGAIVLLVGAGASINPKDGQGLSPLLAAARCGRAECVRLLLSSRGDSRAKDPEGRTAKELAAVYEHERVLQVLAEAGG